MHSRVEVRINDGKQSWFHFCWIINNIRGISSLRGVERKETCYLDNYVAMRRVGINSRNKSRK